MSDRTTELLIIGGVLLIVFLPAFIYQWRRNR